MYNIFFCLFLTLFNYTNISPQYTTFTSSKITTASQEGFLANTLVKTIDGYRNIQDLNVRDFIIGYDKDSKSYYQTQVTALTKTWVSGFIKIIIGNKTIQTAKQQKFYLPQEKIWVNAEDIKPGDYVCTNTINCCSVKHVENIALPALIYAITVEHHHFCITSSDIVVHNSDTASLGSIAAIVTIASLANPICGIIGGTVVAAAAISIVLYKILHRDSHQKHGQDTIHHISSANSTTPCQNPIVLNERVYNAEQIEDQKEESEQSENTEEKESTDRNMGNDEPDPERPKDQEDNNGNDNKDNDKNKSKKVEISKDDESHIFEDRPGHDRYTRK